MNQLIELLKYIKEEQECSNNDPYRTDDIVNAYYDGMYDAYQTVIEEIERLTKE